MAAADWWWEEFTGRGIWDSARGLRVLSVCRGGAKGGDGGEELALASLRWTGGAPVAT
jgi:hypothetical protein